MAAVSGSANAAIISHIREAIVLAVADGKKTLEERALATSSSLGLFGSREELGSDLDMKRAVGAVVGITAIHPPKP